MTSHVSLNLLSYFAIAWLFMMGMFGTIDLLVSVGLHFQEWLRAHRNINTQIPALSASVEELRKRQSRMEMELEQIRRIRESETATSWNVPHANGAGLPVSTARL